MTKRPEEICKIFIWYLKLFSKFSLKKLQTTLQKINSDVKIVKIETVE